MYSTIVNGVDSFADMDSSASVGVAVLVIAAFIVVQLFVIKFLWNTVLVRVVSVAKPLPSLIYTLGLLVLLVMLTPGL